MLRRLILLLFFLTFSSMSFAQMTYVDSLYAQLRIEKEDTNKVKTLNSLGNQLYTGGKYVIADSIGQQELKLATQLNYKKGMAGAYKLLGNVNYDMGNYDAAIKAHTKALEIYTSINNQEGISDCNLDIGVVYSDEGNYPDAIKRFLVSIKIDEKLNRKESLEIGYSGLGIVYEAMGNHDEALKDQNKSLALSREINDMHGIASAYNNIGLINQSKHNYKLALENYQESLNEFNKLGDEHNAANAYNNIGGTYLDEGNYPEALKSLIPALQIARKMGAKYQMITGYGNIGNAYLSEKNFKLAKPYLDSALGVALAINEKDFTKSLYLMLAAYDSITGDFKNALGDYKKYVAFRDSLINEANTRKIVSEQMQFEFDKKQAAEKAEQDKRDTITAAGKKKQEIVIIAVSIVLLLVGIFSVMLLSRFRITQRQKTIIEKQKLLVEEKNKEVFDSITYAKRLQDAILPPLNTIKNYLPESFVLYKPKDIVAGDFYWIAPLGPPKGGKEESSLSPSFGGVGEAVLIAACDCTGHGVPGAMVSVVCSNALNRAVKEFHLTDPGEILDKTRELVLETFEQSEGEIKDGMDISLASLTPSKGGTVIKWAGAYNPLLYIQNGEIKELGPDKQPIGKHDNVRPFTTNVLNLQKGDSLYLFTDGYADQFGGPKGKKFKYKQMQQLIMDNVQLTMAEQKAVLDKTLEDWRGGLEQVDDILIIGIRV